MVSSTGKRVTAATIKSFMARELKNGNLWVKVQSTFDGMVDCVMPTHQTEFHPAQPSILSPAHTLGVKGIWLVGESRYYFTAYEDDDFIGYEVSNCCGSFIIVSPRA
jgi:hypothetical protein